MDLQLNDRVILVVGGRGIVGRAVVDTLRQEGAVALSSSRSPKADVQMDLADDDSVRGAIRRVLDEHGRLDGLGASAAVAGVAVLAPRASEATQTWPSWPSPTAFGLFLRSAPTAKQAASDHGTSSSGQEP